MIRALLMEDDEVIAREVKNFLESHEITCDTVYDGELFFRKLRNNSYDIFLLDINVPRINGLDVCERIRTEDKSTPILMLTAYDQIEDKVDAFSRGADDYLVKPYHLEELLLRINALIRRKQTPQAAHRKIDIADLSIDLDEQTVQRAGVEIPLTPKEYKLLCILAQAQGRVLSKGQIAERLWDYHIETSQNTIEVYINFLRNKVDKNASEKLIHTKVGFGYYLKSE
ncbi:response regulator transcription factor [Rurimicrobium arvi]|uniref:Response regulator transcription factor n=1 Tax=Rurimicrobium arvi TaxID=2049916 RepID=A0ABP8MT07_9BACT